MQCHPGRAIPKEVDVAAQTLPLAGYERFHTYEVDDARTLVTGTLPAFGLRLAERGARLDARMNAMDLDRIGCAPSITERRC